MSILMLGPKLIGKAIDMLIDITGLYDRGSYAQGYLDGFKAGQDGNNQ